MGAMWPKDIFTHNGSRRYTLSLEGSLFPAVEKNRRQCRQRHIVAVSHHGRCHRLTYQASLWPVVMVRRIVVVMMVVSVVVQIQHLHRHTVVMVVRHNHVSQQKNIGQQQE